MSDYIAIDRNRQRTALAGCCAACAVLTIVGSAGGLRAQGLDYIDAVDQSYGSPLTNLYQPNGSALGSSQLDPLTHQEVDGWGWRSYGVPTSGFNTIYESDQRDSPEIRMQLSGLSSGTAYDVYVVYWADRSNNWNIRAGFDSPTLDGGNPPLQVFDRIGDEANEAIAGSYGSSAAWSTAPINSLDTTNEDDPIFFPVDIDPSPFVSELDGEPADSVRDMYMGYVGAIAAGDQMAAGQPSTSASQINVYLDDLPFTDSGNQRSWIEGLAYVPRPVGLPVDEQVPVFTTGVVDRDTGNLTITNPTGVPFDIDSYSIQSEAGGLDATQWNTVGGDWSVTAPPDPGSTQYADELFEEGGTTEVFASDGGVIDFGDVWQRTPFEDLQVNLNLSDGTTMIIFPSFEGEEIVAGDFTGPDGGPDGAIDELDYLALIEGLHAPFDFAAEAYRFGDISGDGVVDRNDVLNFSNVFEGTNGAGSFSAMLSQLGAAHVPEPSSALLAAAAGAIVWPLRRRARCGAVCRKSAQHLAACAGRRARRLVWLTVCLLASVALAADAAAQAVPVINWQADPLLPNASTSPIADADTNHPSIGDMNVEDAARQFNMWANMPEPVSLINGQELVLSGEVTIYGIEGGANGAFRWGLFNDVTEGTDDEEMRDGPTAGWLGYLASNASGGPNGRLDAKNPDANDWLTASHISTNSTANWSGPCDNNATGGPSPGCGARVFNLAEGGSNDGFSNETADTYEFEIVVGRYGEEVTVSASLQSVGITNPIGDYNDNGVVDAADYTVWRDNLGSAVELSNRDAANTGPVSADDYQSWKANFGATGGAGYSFHLGGGIDRNDRPPPGLDADEMEVTPTPHVTFEYNRVVLFFADHLAAEQADVEDVLITPRDIQTVTLEIDLADDGAARFVNNSTEDFDMVYYDITSESGSLTPAGWSPFDTTPDDPPDGIGWNVAGGIGPSVLSEVNLTDEALELATGGSFAELGSIYDTVGGEEDLRFFFIQSDGSTVRGIVQYVNGALGAGSIVPEPSCLSLVACLGLLAVGCHRCLRPRAEDFRH